MHFLNYKRELEEAEEEIESFPEQERSPEPPLTMENSTQSMPSTSTTSTSTNDLTKITSTSNDDNSKTNIPFLNASFLKNLCKL